jgi:hypothetical protein
MLALFPAALKQLFQIAVEKKVEPPSQTVAKQIRPETTIQCFHPAFVPNYIAQDAKRVAWSRFFLRIELQPILKQVERMCSKTRDDASTEARYALNDRRGKYLRWHIATSRFLVIRFYGWKCAGHGGCWYWLQVVGACCKPTAQNKR